MKTRGRIDREGNPVEFIGAYVPGELKDRLQRWAKSEDRNLSNLVLRILRDAVAAHEQIQSRRSAPLQAAPSNNRQEAHEPARSGAIAGRLEKGTQR